MDSHAFLVSAALLLAAAVIAVPIAKRLGLGAVLGYLIAGVAIGPWGLGLIKDPAALIGISEFGVVLLLFIIGLELEPKRLWQMRSAIFGLGSAQVLATGLAIALAARLAGWGWPAAVVAGLSLALSSTAIALKPLTERGLMNTRGGSATFAVLLFQDIAVIPILALIPLLGPEAGAKGGSPVAEALRAFAVIVGLILVGRYVLPPAFRYVARTGLREVFTAFSLLLVVSVAMLMHAVELSMALGAFLSGVLLAESEYRHELESNIEPFKALLLGLFFLSVGMNIDFGLALARPGVTVAAVAAMLALKLVLLFALARLWKLPPTQCTLFALLLAGGGEFAFVLAQVAEQRGVLAREDARLMVIAVALSMVVAPLMLAVYDRLIAPRFAVKAKPPPDVIVDQKAPAIIAGFGRVGQVVSRVLHANGFATTVLDNDPDRVESARQFGFKVFYGDAARLDLLETAGIARARVLVIAVDDRDAAVQLAQLVLEKWPHVPVVSRAWDLVHAWRLMDMGVEHVHKESFMSALAMASDSLRILGLGAHRAERAVQRFARHDQVVVQELYKVSRDDMSVRIAVSKKLREEIERVFAEDRKKLRNWEQEG
jgi:glutathione-regulated potassium-efflux system ancillary protein KefC